MKNKLLLVLFALSILPLFSQENKIFWDLGVTINAPKKELTNNKTMLFLFIRPVKGAWFTCPYCPRLIFRYIFIF